MARLLPGAAVQNSGVTVLRHADAQQSAGLMANNRAALAICRARRVPGHDWHFK